ncbi:adaptive-response sensory-kinase SasA [Rhodoferax lithotrophicus]|uniref:histidine kinase n=1 Tax=Rhodoferax lithotrophicus TaxID=2798804 RepID=A0ABM7MT77_9BURK|nr:ATP-binding protein [Rhodoferax sp. MIZ03]BCO29575.1 adaptive-response sensory-kinase SasA [Rhodoferax sp. MIZ03]
MQINWRVLSSSLSARMALILLAGLLAAQGVSIWLQWSERATAVTQARGMHVMDRIAEVVRLLEAHAPQQRQSALAALQRDGMNVALITESQALAGSPREPLQANLSERLGSPHEIRVMGGLGPGMGWGMGARPQHLGTNRSMDVRLDDGQWIRITGRYEVNTPAPALSDALIIQLLLSLGLVVVVVVIAIRQATRPLEQLAKAADMLGRDLDAPPLAEEGPAETRRAAQAFNRMQAKIKLLVSERARALAAVSHDLRTPLTRLRLRTELIDDETLRNQMAADLEAMGAMMDATLDYLRAFQTNEVVRTIDINALLESMVDDSKVLGRSIQINGRTTMPYRGRLSALRRAMQNLIDNAFKHAGGAQIRVEDSALRLCITVEDQGPGIAPENLAKVTDPYYRVDSARSQKGDGVGLGLSIVKDIALIHNGELLLANRPTGGLSATLVLPRN